MKYSPEEEIQILYTNYRGETSKRTIVPKQMLFTSTPWHPKNQWCLLAFDVEKQQDRYFAFCDIKAIWKNETELAEKT